MGNICKLLGVETPGPCPNKDEKGACEGCIDTWRERASLIEFGGMDLRREAAEALAKEQMRAALKGQRKMF